MTSRSNVSSQPQESRRRTPAPKGLLGRIGAWLEDADRRILGVPARIMEPRLFFILAVVVLVALGLVMVYSASSIKGLLSDGENPASFFNTQLRSCVLGAVLCVFLAKLDYRKWMGGWPLYALCLLSVGLLLGVHLFGFDSHGATRWIRLGPISFQPSEFAKIYVVAAAAAILAQFWGDQARWDLKDFAWKGGLMVALPLALILFQPDKGTTLVLGLVILSLALMAGVPTRLVVGIAAVCAAGYLALSLKDDYSRQRLLVMFDPWADSNKTGYQLTQGFYGFGSGGLLGVGLGLGRQKYGYLPEAHNDMVFAVIGEELGLVGCLAVFALFGVLLVAGLRIAKQAPDLMGTLLASGITLLIFYSMVLNVAGVIGIFPQSGKALPFISYGGTALMATLMQVGVILSVSIHSRLPETVHDQRRRSLKVATGPAKRASGVEGSTAGEAQPRSLRLVEGGSSRQGPEARPQNTLGPARGSAAPAAEKRPSAKRRTSTSSAPKPRPRRGSGGWERIDLGPSSTERLRPHSGPQVRERRGSGRGSQRDPNRRNHGRRS